MLDSVFDACEKDNTKDATGKPFYRFYGKVYRENVCAAEIYNECFSSSDKRKSIAKISDILDKLDGWQQGERLRNSDPQYTDKKKCYYRITPCNED